MSGSSIEFLGERVRKIVGDGDESKIKRQYVNLQKINEAIGDCSVEVFDLGDTYYDMAFCPGVSFDVYCTMCTQQAAFHRLKEIIVILVEKLYSRHTAPVPINEYIDYLFSRSDAYAKLGNDVSDLQTHLRSVQTCLSGDTPLEDAQAGVVHGDLTFENIMVTADSFVLLDSNPPPGGIACMALDIGKLRQSLFSYYELTKYTGPKSRAGLKATYKYLADRFSYLFPVWNETLDLQSRFYEASHYTRLLDYAYHGDPAWAAAYYKRAVELIGEVYAELNLRKI